MYRSAGPVIRLTKTTRLSTPALAAAIALSLPLQAFAQATVGDWGVNTDSVSGDIAPGEDFYRYVNEGWIEQAEIPPGMPYNATIIEAVLRTEARLDAIISDIVDSDPEPGTDEYNIKMLFLSYTDLDRLNQLGMSPIQGDLDDIAAIDTREDLARVLAGPFTASPFGAGVTIDGDNPETHIVAISQAGLRLPSRDIYVVDDDAYSAVRLAYRNYMIRTFERAGFDEAEARADAAFALEAGIAGAQWTKAASRDPVAMYHPMSVDELETFAPDFDWEMFLASKDFGDVDRVVVNNDTAIRTLAELTANVPLEDWKNWLVFRMIDSWSAYLDEDSQMAQFDFDKILSGVSERRPLEARAVHFITDQRGVGYYAEPVGRYYLDLYFPPENVEQLEIMFEYLRRAFRARLAKLEWMDDETRAEALDKVNNILLLAGGPETYMDYASIPLEPDDLVGNIRRIAAFEQEMSLKRLGDSRRMREWPWAAQMVNAGYQPTYNRVLFPAAFMQPPYFDPEADPAVNFGAIAAVIGHEVGHGFDDSGSHYDSTGRLRNWWTDAAAAGFKEQADRLVAQYSAYEPIPDVHLNGQLTLGENIGDHAGVAIAFDAWRLYVDEELGGEAPVIDGYTGDQRFFLAWAQAWRNKMLEAETRRRVLTDPHSPGEFRVNGVLRNTDAWYEAFDVGPDDALYLQPEQRVRLW